MAEYTPSHEHLAFAMRLRAARKLQGLTQTELAKLLGVSLPRYHAWEKSIATPNSLALYHELCRNLNVTMDWLFFGDTRGLDFDISEKLTLQ